MLSFDAQLSEATRRIGIGRGLLDGGYTYIVTGGGLIHRRSNNG